MSEEVKQALENLKYIKEDLDYFQPKGLTCTNREEQYKSIETALNDFDRYYESQQDLIKGKDEYIAKLLDENKKAKDNFVKMVTAKDKLNAEINKEKEELKKQLKDLREFARIVIEKDVKPSFIKRNSLGTYNNHIKWNYEDEADNYMLTQSEFDLVKKVVEKYGNKR